MLHVLNLCRVWFNMNFSYAVVLDKRKDRLISSSDTRYKGFVISPSDQHGISFNIRVSRMNLRKNSEQNSDIPYSLPHPYGLVWNHNESCSRSPCHRIVSFWIARSVCKLQSRALIYPLLPFHLLVQARVSENMLVGTYRWLMSQFLQYLEERKTRTKSDTLVHCLSHRVYVQQSQERLD